MSWEDGPGLVVRVAGARDAGSVRTDCQSNSRRLNGNALANRFIERATIGRDAVKRISARNRELAGLGSVEADRSSWARVLGIFVLDMLL